MHVDDAFLSLLMCPITRQGLRRLTAERLAALNARVLAGSVRTASGRAVAQPLDEALLTEDGSRLYPVRDGIPILLAEEAVAVEAE